MKEEYLRDPDVALMLRVAEGDRAAFEKLVVKYHKLVIHTAYRYTGNPSVAEELAQDVFVRVFRAASSYTPGARFTTWLFTIVRNVCANYRTREGKHDSQMNPDEEIVARLPDSGNPESAALEKERVALVRQAVGSLPESLRLPLILFQFNHLSYGEVAEVMDISLAAVKVRIHRARQALLDKLRPYMARERSDVTGADTPGLE